MNTEPEPSQLAERKALNAALAKAQAEFREITRSKTVKTGSYEFSYAPLEKILQAVKPVLAKHGLALTQVMDQGGLRTELRHEAGGVVSGWWPLKDQGSAQELGKLVTYIRRYALSSMLGLAADDDTDGPEAEGVSEFARPEGAPVVDYLTAPQRRNIYRLKEKLNLDGDTFDTQVSEDYGVLSVGELTKADASALIRRLKVKAGEE